MRANQYRLGNLVKYNGKIYEIDSISKEFPTLNTIEYGIGVVDWNNIEPIPLTEEWLVRFGFEKCLNGFWCEKDFLNVKLIDSDIVIFISGTDHDLNIHSKVQYVHQLQNLYFALTNQELTIKP